MTETVLAYRKPGADQAEAEKIANAAADALARRLVSDGFWIDREHRSYAYAFPDDVTHQQGKTGTARCPRPGRPGRQVKKTNSAGCTGSRSRTDNAAHSGSAKATRTAVRACSSNSSAPGRLSRNG
jgi:hypothetical protein